MTKYIIPIHYYLIFTSFRTNYKKYLKNGEESYWNKDGSIRYKDIYINGKVKK